MRQAAVAFALSLLFSGCAIRLSDAQIEKLAAAANQSRKTGVCNIHHMRMQKELVRVEYAHLPLDYYSSAFHDARLREFPNSREYVLSLNPRDEGKKVRVFVCPYCKAAERGWIQKHPTDEWGKTLGPRTSNQALQPTAGRSDI